MKHHSYHYRNKLCVLYLSRSAGYVRKIAAVTEKMLCLLIDEHRQLLTRSNYRFFSLGKAISAYFIKSYAFSKNTMRCSLKCVN